MKKVFLKIIRLYQSTISPDHGFWKQRWPHGFCRYYPSCSEYGYQSISKYGIWKGTVKAIWRVVRCNPFSDGGHDPVK